MSLRRTKKEVNVDNEKKCIAFSSQMTADLQEISYSEGWTFTETVRQAARMMIADFKRKKRKEERKKSES